MMRCFVFLLTAAGLVCAQPATYTNSIGMEFVLAPSGSLLMGKFEPQCAPVGLQDNVTESQHAECVKMSREASRPGFQANIPRPFYIGKFEVTQGQYRKVMGANPSHFPESKAGENADDYPVDSVTWQDAQAFVQKLNAIEKSRAYRLPTEMEWEYAARAGATDEVQGLKKPEAAWFMSNAQYTTHPAGRKSPNAWGIYDMLGNVWEWVRDFYDEQVQPGGPVGPRSGKVHVLRGGSYSAHDKNVRVSVHAGGPGGVIDVGFRIVKDAQ
jgi:formylglycine-generating enzyme